MPSALRRRNPPFHGMVQQLQRMLFRLPLVVLLLQSETRGAMEDVLHNMLQRKHSSSPLWNRLRQQFLHPPTTGEESTTKRRHSGWKLTRHFPTPERVAKWYGTPSSSSSSNSHRRSSGLDTATLCNHRLAGRTNPMLHWPSSSHNASSHFSSSWRRIQLRATVGHGAACYRACRDAALRWEFAAPRCGVVAVRETASLEDANSICWGPGRRLITYTTLGPLRKWYLLNPVTVLYSIVDQPFAGNGLYTATAFGTRPGHWLRGEERVTVSHRPDDQVDVEVVSYSRPSSSLTGGVFWALRPWQESFFRAQLAALQRVAADANAASSMLL